MFSAGIKARLRALGLDYSEKLKSPIAEYVSAKMHDGLIFVSGQLPFLKSGELAFAGKVPRDISVEQATQAARICSLNAIIHAASLLNDNIDLIDSCIKIEVFINSTEDFSEHSAIGDGAYQVMSAILGEDKGSMARVSIGASSLPLSAAVEVGTTFSVLQ